MKMRWYQEEAVSAFFAAAAKYPSDDLLEVLPTGAGKTIVMANVIKGVREWGGRVIVTARTKELLIQNQDKFCRSFPELASETGVYCAGLGMRSYDSPIVFASVQSAFGKGELFGPRKLAIIDEAHQIPVGDQTQYQTLLAGLRSVEPTCKLLGLTASPYRLDGGVIFGPGQQFDRVCYNVPLGTLMDEGWITRPETLDVSNVDMTGVRKSGGDFSRADMETRFLGTSITEEALNAANEKGATSILVFASGVTHAETIRHELEDLGEGCRVITGETLPLMREASIREFTDRKCRWLVNVECLTTGFDATAIDMVVIARATESPGLFLQMVGRGFRLHEGKETCWVLDYGGNIERHGAIDDPKYGMDTIKAGSAGGEAPTRICPSCFEICHAGAAKCNSCGLEFPRKPKEFSASRQPITQKPVTLDVLEVSYARHGGRDGKLDTLRADYICDDPDGAMGRRRVSEWVCIEHTGYAREKAHRWWRELTRAPFPESITEALDVIEHGVAGITSIKVKRDGKWDRVVGRTVGEQVSPPDYSKIAEEAPF